MLASDVGNRLAGSGLLERLDLERLAISNRLVADPQRRADLGQFITPANVASFMASMLDLTSPPEQLRVLDPGGGNGMLTAAVVAEVCSRPESQRPAAMHLVTWEIDSQFQPLLHRTFEDCETVCRQAGIALSWDVRCRDFIFDAADLIVGRTLFTETLPSPFHIVVMNPPYRKLRSSSGERSRLNALGMGTSNMYSAFVWLALELMEDGGELVAITPRSFMNGVYFRPFRKVLVEKIALRRLHVYEARNVAFASDSVLQENVVFHGVRGGVAGHVKLTTSHGPHDTGLTERIVEPWEVVSPDDPESVIRVVADENEARIADGMHGLSHKLSDLGLSVSTGRVVGFRAKDRLQADARIGDAPMILPRHCRDGFVVWPQDAAATPNGLTVSGPDDDLILPSGWYVLVNRFSAKEDRRRVVATLFDPGRVNADCVAFDNKLNVLHDRNGGLSEGLAKGLAVFLNSSVVDSYFRQFSGHTQVNAGDLRTMRFPDPDALVRLGMGVGEVMPTPGEIDLLLKNEVPAMNDSVDAVQAGNRVQEALTVLRSVGVQRGQLNERSALTLLALLDLGPEDSWADSTAPLRGVTEIMGWMSDRYGKSYAPNTRETIRRFTLHQFMGMGLVVLNPDDPGRPVNSPNNAYQVHASVLELVKSHGTDGWEKSLAEFLGPLALRDRLSERERDMAQIPVELPGGAELLLSAGGQNVLVKDIIEEFAPRFVPGGYVVYVGDAGDKYLLYDAEYMAELGVVIDEHGRMPDVVIHHVERDWLIVIEAVTSHGPVNPLRRAQLKELFANCRSGLVYVTTFQDRDAMRRYLSEIAWETEVWVADAPTHLIHFDGEKFLGPYSE